jgi:hypothetical protein
MHNVATNILKIIATDSNNYSSLKVKKLTNVNCFIDSKGLCKGNNLKIILISLLK